ncbi:MAG TPA: DUF1775 domain-containing protein [Candidatus Binatia bacterium]
MRALLALVLLVLAAPAAAHMVVLPETSTTGGAQRYTLIVPTEGNSATVRIEVRLPMGVDVAAVESKPGWQASNQAFPIGAATVRWAGGKIPPGEMMSFDFLAVNPPAARVLTWNATQWYEDGSNERWGDGADEEHHASTTTLVAAEAAGHDAAPTHDTAAHEHGDHHAAEPAHDHAEPAGAGGSPYALRIALAALGLSAAALVAALRR